MADSVNLKGRSGRAYAFERYPLNTPWNSVGVVYAVLNTHVLYVGQTNDLKTRFSNHEHARDFAYHRATHLAVRQVAREDERKAIEADLVGGYSPPINETDHG